MHKNRPNLSFDFRETARDNMRGCDHPGCLQAGEYRAPKGRDRLNEYYWFCLEHVRQYNLSWDYYAGMSGPQIEAEVRQDTTWQRPTWPMGDWRTRERRARDKVFNSGFAFGADWSGDEAERATASRPRPRTPEDDALATLELPQGADFATIKARYRQLAKQHHPDANGGSKEAEERLKSINQAYNILKAAFGGSA